MWVEKQLFLGHDFRGCFSSNIIRGYFMTDSAYGFMAQSLNNQPVRNYSGNAVMWFFLGELDRSSFSAGFFSINLPSGIFIRQG